MVSGRMVAPLGSVDRTVGGLVYVRAPRRSDIRYLIAWSVLLAGLCLPLAPNWGPGFWRSTAESPSSSTGTQPVRELSITSADAVIPQPVDSAMAPLTFPPEYLTPNRMCCSR